MASPEPAFGLKGYLDACATSPPSAAVLEAMARAMATAWANPSSLHGPGLAAAESLERSRQLLADRLGADAEELIFTSGATESIHLALRGTAQQLEPGRLVISAVEHPATLAAAAHLARQGWTVAVVPVDRRGVLQLEALEALLTPPTRLVSLIWGQSEVGSLQPLALAGALCRAAGVPLHVDAVQVVGHLPVGFASLPVELLTCTAHKLQGPRGIGLLLRRRGQRLSAQQGGPQEAGLRGGTEPVVLAAGFAQAVVEATDRLERHGQRDPLSGSRDRLLQQLLELPGVRLSGPEPTDLDGRLPHHISLLLSTPGGVALAGRQLVRHLAQEGLAVSSGSACSSGSGGPLGGASPVLRAMGYGDAEAASGLRLSLGPWLDDRDLDAVPEALARALRRQDPSHR
jgi:cysteine desulfurase